MDKAGIIRRVQNQFGDTTGAHLTTTMIEDWVTDAETELVRETECVVYTLGINLSQGESDIDFDHPGGHTVDGSEVPPTTFETITRFQKINRVSLVFDSNQDDHIELYFLEEQQFNRMNGPDLSTQGRPKYYTVVGNVLRVYPVPEETVNVTISGVPYFGPLSDLNDTDEPRVPLKHHRDLVSYCMWQASMMDNDWERAEMFRNNWESALFRGRSDAENPSSYSYAKVKVLDDDYIYPGYPL